MERVYKPGAQRSISSSGKQEQQSLPGTAWHTLAQQHQAAMPHTRKLIQLAAQQLTR
jgi:hypothetical protein